MKFKTVIALILFLIIMRLESPASIVDEELCGTVPPLTTSLADIDTVRVLTLFTAGSFQQEIPGMEEMKQWMYDVWDTTLNTSLPHFYQTTSFSKFKMTGDSYPIGDTAFLTDLPWGSFFDHDAHRAYMEDILPKADSVIDFGLYDNRGPNGSSTPDGIVDYFVFVTLTAGRGGGWAGVGVNYATADTNSLGDNVEIRKVNSTWLQVFNQDTMLEWCANGDSALHLSGKFRFVGYFIHETNHHIGIHHHSQPLSFGSVGGFQFYANAVSSPHSPFWQDKKTWADPRTLSEPLYSAELPDRNLADTTSFKLTTAVSNFQGFFVTGHKRAVREERDWPVPNDLGTMIWHFNDYGSNRLRKKADVEVPLGLFNWDIEDCSDPGEISIDEWLCNIEDTNCTVSYQMLTGQPNTVNGLDSLDWPGAWPRNLPYPAEAKGSMLCLWDGISHRHFDGTTNPSSDFYPSPYSYVQNTSSRIAVRNISIDSANAKIYADLLVNNWYDTLTADHTIWGDSTQHTGYAITGDIIVKAGDTLSIEKGTTVYFQADEDILEGGEADSLCELIVYGTLIAEGTSSDSILFVPSSEQLASSEPGDWYGIRFMPGSNGVMKYCGVRSAEYGIEMRNNSNIAITECSIGNNSTAGIYNYGGYLDLVNSTVAYNGTYGLYGYQAADSVYNTKFIDNELYGIKIEGTTQSNDSTFLLYDTLSYVSSPSQYGILVDNNDYIRIEQCKISGYDQGAIYLTNSDAIINDCDFTSTIDYSTQRGIYTVNNSYPVVRSCVFDFVKIGVKAVTGGKPDLGFDIGGENGNSSFLSCYHYFVHFSGLAQGSDDTLWAQRNWWGFPVDTTKFYTDDPVDKIIQWWPPLSEQPKMETNRQIPLVFSLSQNIPNPFNPTTTISFALDKPAHTVLSIYNLLGQRVTVLKNEHLNPGQYSIVWDGRNDSGESVSSGVYFYTIESGDRFDSKKMLLLR